MKRLCVFLAMLVSSSLAFALYGEERLSYVDLLKSKSAKEILRSDVKLYWAGQATPEFGESTLPDTFSGFSLFFHRELKFHCAEAFEKALSSMVADAQEKGYDAVIGIRQVLADGSLGDPYTLICKPSSASTVIQLSAHLARTKEVRDRLENEGRKIASQSPRSPARNSVFLPLEPILNSPEAKAMLGSDIAVQVGFASPAFGYRFGPIGYEKDADIDKPGVESACKQAVLDTLENMVDDAKDKGYDMVINIVSHLDEQFAPPGTDVECRIDKKSVTVSLQASLAKKK